MFNDDYDESTYIVILDYHNWFLQGLDAPTSLVSVAGNSSEDRGRGRLAVGEGVEVSVLMNKPEPQP